MNKPVLEITALRTVVRIGRMWHPAVDNVSFCLHPKEMLALIGESGCGKSMTALSIMGLVPEPAARIASGSVKLDGTELVGLRERQLEKIRGREVAMIFQDPMTSLNPMMPVGQQIAESLRVHNRVSLADANDRALSLLEEVRIPAARSRFYDYPHQFSGGMRQRVMIAVAIACNPRLLVADEPTTALDVTIQAQVLTLISDLRRQHGMAVLFITHNLGIVAQIADRVAVMYAGQIVEHASVDALFARPLHPYTRALLATIPRMDSDNQELVAIRGRVPALTAMPAGCRFASRCSFARAGCEQTQELKHISPSHQVRCHLAGEMHNRIN